jgi:sugar phosphate permease
MKTAASISPAPAEHSVHDALYRRVTWQLLPFLFLCYLLAFIDRINIGYAHLQMAGDLGIGDAAYGLGAGAFFVGYIVFQTPSNMLLHRFGARKTISRIMISWGIVSAATLFVRNPTEFVLARAALGVCEAGFFPGIIYYLTFWYPRARRGRIIALFMTAIPVAGVLVGPICTTIMTSMGNLYGLHGWQWLFLLEGIPTVLIGVVASRYIVDRPKDAKWLSASEKSALANALDDTGEHSHSSAQGLREAIVNPRVYILAMFLFAAFMGGYGIAFWMPALLKSAGASSLIGIGWLSVVPYAIATVCMILVGNHSDATQERRWHVAGPGLVAAIGLLLLTLAGQNVTLAVVALVLAKAGELSVYPVFWTIPSRYLKGASAAAGIALVDSIGTLGGISGPWLMGVVRAQTGNANLAFYLIVILMILAVTMLLVTTAEKSRDVVTA